MKSRNVSLNCGAVEAPARAAHSGRRFVLSAFMFFALGLSVLLTGCAANFNPQLTGADPSSAVGSLKGNIHGGQAPIYGAAVYVMQTGLSGYPLTVNAGPTNVYAAANTSLITSSGAGTFTGSVNGTSHGTYVLTDFNGNFIIPGFTCTPGAGVYIYSVGGEPIYGTPNNAATEMAAMGICPSGGASALAASVPFVNVNEVSTVAMAYALEGFTETGLDASHISSSSSNTVGLANAFGTAAALYTVSQNNGANQYISGQSSNTAISYQTINTLANILSDCINSNGSTSSSSTPCYILFQNATSNGVSGGGTIPTDTASAAINIAHWPQSNVSALFALASNSYAPYTPTYSSAPSNFAVTITYYGDPNMSEPTIMKVDSSGYVYAVSPVSPAGSLITGLAKISPYSGVIGSTSSSASLNISLDKSNDLFFTSGQSIIEYAPSTTSLLGSAVGTFSQSASATITSVAIGPSNNLLLIEVPSSGVDYDINVPFSGGSYNLNSPTTTFGANYTYPAGTLFQNSSGIVWLEPNQQNFFTGFNGSTPTRYNFSTTSDFTNGLALDIHGEPYLTSYNGNSLYGYDTPSSPTRVTGGGMSSPQVPAFDGDTVLFIPNSSACVISVTSLFQAHNGITGGWVYPSGLTVPNCTTNSSGGGIASVAVDGSGNVWTGVYQPSTSKNSGTGQYLQNGFVVELVGLGGATIEPLALQSAYISSGNYDVRP